jgi:hypothetical protein
VAAVVRASNALVLVIIAVLANPTTVAVTSEEFHALVPAETVIGTTALSSRWVDAIININTCYAITRKAVEALAFITGNCWVALEKLVLVYTTSKRGTFVLNNFCWTALIHICATVRVGPPCGANAFEVISAKIGAPGAILAWRVMDVVAAVVDVDAPRLFRQIPDV